MRSKCDSGPAGRYNLCRGRQAPEPKQNTAKADTLTQGFGWQDGFGAFTVSVSQKDKVVEYIENQMVHHSKQSFEDEYLHLLNKHEIEFDPKYVWD